MPAFERDGVRLGYDERGDGFAVLLIAPGGMRSRRGAWAKAPWNPRERLDDRYRVISMDQRNAGASTAPVRADDGWETYARDQLALLDHLGVKRFAVIGMCIGGPYIMGLCRAAPDRVAAAVMLQPIGLHDNRPAFEALFDDWVADIGERHPEADADTWASFRRNMFGGDFMFGASRDDVAACRTPLLVLRGDDLYHPASISHAVAEAAPEATLIERWKEGEDRDAAHRTITSFLATYAH